MAKDQLVVRTPQDKEREKHEEELLAAIRQANVNPFQRVGEGIWNWSTGVYADYLYTSGVMLILFSMWTAYPSCVRYRHAHIKRYRRDQLIFRRWFFASTHMPKWDKKYLQRIVIPPPLLAHSQPDLFFAAAAAEAKAATATPGGAAAQVAVQPPQSSDVAAAAFLSQPKVDDPFANKVLSASQSARSEFHQGYESQSAALISRALADLNETVYSREGQFKRTVDTEVDTADVKSRVEWTAHQAKACIVLKESYTTLRNIPPGWEVWWASAEEQKRRNTCKFWFCGIAFCRALQDLLYMPDMPQVVQ